MPGPETAIKPENQMTLFEYYIALANNGVIPKEELASQIPLTLGERHIEQICLMYELYKMIQEVPGMILEFGVFYGKNLANLLNLRNLLEPKVHSRRIVGFDTFTGLKDVDPEFDSISMGVQEGDFKTTDGYRTHLEKFLHARAGYTVGTSGQHSWELVDGHIEESLPKWLEQNRGATVALACFDMDLFKPTEFALRNILPICTKGSVLMFDNAAYSKWFGEGMALQSVLEIREQKLRKLPFSNESYFLVLE